MSTARRIPHPSRSLGSGCTVAVLMVIVACDETSTLAERTGELSYPERVELGRVPLGLGRSVAIELANVGTLTVSVFEWRVAGAAATVEPEALAIPPGGRARVRLRYVPSAEGPFEVPVTFRTDAGPDAVRTLALAGRAVRQGLLVAPDPIRFEPVLRGRTATVTARLTSVLPEPIALDLTLEGEAGRFELVLPRPERDGRFGILSPGEARDLLLRYHPALLGPGAEDTGTLRATFCDGLDCEVRISLWGRAVVEPLVCAPERVDFGQVPRRTTRARFVACAHVGARPVEITSVGLAPGAPRELSLPNVDGSPITLAPGDLETFEIRLDATGTAPIGARATTFVVRARVGLERDDAFTVELPVVGGVGTAEIALEPASVDVGRVALGQSGEARFRVRNDGDALLAIEGLAVEPPFAVPGEGFQLAPGESREVAVRFTPTTAGPATGRVRITTNLLEGFEANLPVSGTGLDLAPCEARIEPAGLDFDARVVFRTATGGIRVVNDGEAPCLLREPRVGPPFFLGDESRRDILLEPGEAWTFVAAYRPVVLDRIDTASFGVEISNPDRPRLDVPVRGYGVRRLPLFFAPGEVDFGELPEGCASSQTVRVTNELDELVHVTRVALAPEDAADSAFEVFDLPFTLTPGWWGVVLQPGQSFELSVRFRGRAGAGRRMARVVVDTVDHGSVALPVFGTSALAPFVEERWQQGGSRSVDLLVVLDNSRTMGPEQAQLRSAFARFFRYAEEQDVDYRVAVVSTEADPGGPCASLGPTVPPLGACGFFSEGSDAQRWPEWRIIERGEQPSPAFAFEHTSGVGLGGPVASAGIAAAATALSPARLVDWNAGFAVDPAAFLAVLFVDDEDDASTGDLDLLEARLAALKGGRFRDRYAASGLIATAASCGSDAPRYRGIIDRSGGATGSVCEPFDATLDRVARIVTGTREIFRLRRPALASSVEVRVDGVPLAATSSGKPRWTWDSALNAVVFAPRTAPPEGSEVVIRYAPRCGTAT